MQVVEQFWHRFRLDFRNVSLSADKDWRQRKSGRIHSKTLFMFLFQLISNRGRGSYSFLTSMAQEFLASRAKTFAPSSLCEARGKLDAAFVRDLFDRTIDNFESSNGGDLTWQGHRLFGLDGTKLNLPRELIEDGFPLPEPGYYPQAMMSCLYSLQTQVPFDYDIETSHNERVGALRILPRLFPSDVVVYDRGYLSYGLLCEHVKLGINGVFRLQEGTTFSEIKAFQNQEKVNDLVITITPHKVTMIDTAKKYPSIQLRESVKIRVLSYKIGDKKYWLATTLMDPKKYTINKLKELYHARWGVEEFFKSAKHYLGIERFQSRTLRGVMQEIHAGMVLLAVTKIVAYLEQNPSIITQKKFQPRQVAELELLSRLGAQTSNPRSSIAQKV